MGNMKEYVSIRRNYMKMLSAKNTL